MKKTILAYFLPATMALGLFAFSSCRQGKSESHPSKNEYASVTGSDLATYVRISYPPSQIVTLTQTLQKRKQIIDRVMRAFAVAQAAQADELDTSEDFYKHLALNTTRLLAREYSKRDENLKVSRSEIDLYLAGRSKEFDTDLALTLMDGKQPQNSQAEDSQKAQWAEMHLRAEKGRQAGIEKEAAFQQIVRLLRADILASIYLKKLKEQYKTTEADFRAYYTQHPEADPENIKQRMSAILIRIRNGEGFEKIANEINDDSTKGKGGDLGWFGEGVMAPELEKASFALQPGQISQEPIKTTYGYHLVKVDGRRKKEIHAKHIFLSTRASEEAISGQTQGKIDRAIEDIKLKYPVNAPEDFEINVEGLNQSQSPPTSNRGKVGR